MVSKRSSRVSASVLGLGWVLIECAGQPALLLTGLRSPHAWVAEVGTDAAAITLAGALLWLVALWTALTLSVAALALLPGRAGSAAQAVAARLTPVVVRRIIGTAAGTSILISPVAAFADPPTGSASPAASAQSAAVPQIAVSIPMDRPEGAAGSSGPSASPSMPALGWPTDPAAAEPPAAAPDPAAAGDVADRVGRAAGERPTRAVSKPAAPPAIPPPAAPPPAAVAPKPAAPPAAVAPKAAAPLAAGPGDRIRVRPGDSLWSITAHRLGATASAARIQGEWPRWYAVNRQLIGADPNLLKPGVELLAPRPAGLDADA